MKKSTSKRLEKDVQVFARALWGLSTMELMGLVRTLNIKTVEYPVLDPKNPSYKDGETILMEVIDKFISLGAKQRSEILQIMHLR